MTVKHKGIFVFSALIIVMFYVLGWFSRPYPADEYGFYNSVAAKGWLQAQTSMYMNWAGRVFNTFLVCSSVIFPLEKMQPFVAVINSLTYILACLSLVSAIFPAIAFGAKISLSLLACTLTLCFTYSLRQTFYWLPGMPYFWSGTLIILALSLAIRAYRGSHLSFILCMIVLFLNATNLEQPCIFQGIIAFLAMLMFMVRGNRKGTLMSGAFWLVSIAGFCVMYFAPGTAVRMSSMTTAEHSVMRDIMLGLRPALSLGILEIFQFLAKPLIYIVLFFMPAIAAKIPPFDEKLSRRVRVWHIVAAVLAVSVLMELMCGFASAGWGLPERGTSLNLWLMYFTWNVLWIFFYRQEWIFSDKFRSFCAKWRWIFLVVSVLISANFIDCIRDLRIAPDYADEWDNRHTMMTAQAAKGEKTIIAPLLKNKPRLMFWKDIALLKNNEDIARYYGAEEVRVIPGEISGDAEVVREILAGNVAPLGKLAENGDTDIALFLGRYRDFRGNVEKEALYADEAIKWYTIASEGGNIDAMKSLSRLLLPRNFMKSAYWLGKYTLLMTRF